MPLPLPSQNGYPTHSMTMPLPLQPPQCEHLHCIPGNPLDSNDVIAIAVIQCERTFRNVRCKHRHLLLSPQVCYPIESMSQFKYKPRVQSQFESPKYISNSHSHPSNLSQTGSIMSAHAQYRLCTCSVKGKHDTKI